MSPTLPRNLLRLAILIAVASVPSTTSQPSSYPGADAATKQLFEQWMGKYGRQYKDQIEKAYRYVIFKSNLAYIEMFNRQTTRKYKLSINHFADLTIAEFNTMINNTQAWLPAVSSGIRSRYANPGAVPGSIDWRLEGAVTPIKDQGKCGCCWVFASVATMESISKIAKGRLVSLSEQELMDCSTGNACKGGSGPLAYQFVVDNGGLTAAKNYPYSAVDRDQCNTAWSSVISIRGYGTIPANDEGALMHAVAGQPVYASILIGSLEFQFFSGTGVFDGPCGSTANHAVAVIGYGVERDGTKYWLIKNSWGTDWGNGGYGKIAREATTAEGVCSIARRVSYPVA